MALTGRTAALAAAGALVVAIALPSATGVLTVTGLVGALAALDLLLAGSARLLTFTRSGARSVRLGSGAPVELLVTNPSSRRVHGVLRDAWPPSANAQPDRQRLDVPPGEHRRLTTTVIPTRRGDRHGGQVTVRAVGPLGLAARQATHQVPWTVRTLPTFPSRRHLPARLSRLRELDGRTSALVRGQGAEFDSLREYVVGDDVRGIDWRATARRREVVVRTWRPERDRHVLIVLDTGRTSAGRVGDVPRLDHAMDAALLLAVLATRAGDRVDLLAYDREVRADLRRTARSDVLPRLTHTLATLDSELVETDYRGLTSAVATRTSQRSLVVIVTGLDTAVVDEGLLPTLGLLTRRHEVLITSVTDPSVDVWARGRGDAASVYGAGAAERARAERDQARMLLRRHGVGVVDEPPDSLAPALADAYLALKKSGRL